MIERATADRRERTPPDLPEMLKQSAAQLAADRRALKRQQRLVAVLDDGQERRELEAQIKQQRNLLRLREAGLREAWDQVTK